MQRRRLLADGAALVAAMMTGWTGTAMASGPSKPLTLVVPFPPGGGGDVLARSVTEQLQEQLGQRIVVFNRPGAGGSLGAHAVASAKSPDTLCYVTNGIMCVNEHLYDAQRLKPMRDLRPVGQISRIDMMMVIKPGVLPGVDSWESFLAYAKAHPGDVNYASAGVGTTSHLAGALIAKTQGLDLVHIPHAGGAAARMELLAGRIPFMIDVIANVLPSVQRGELIGVAVASGVRNPVAPDIPTFAELGAPEVKVCAWDGLAVSANTSLEKCRLYNVALNKALAEPSVQRRLSMLGAVPSPTDLPEFSEFILQQREFWADLIGFAVPK